MTDDNRHRLCKSPTHENYPRNLPPLSPIQPMLPKLGDDFGDYFCAVVFDFVGGGVKGRGAMGEGGVVAGAGDLRHAL